MKKEIRDGKVAILFSPGFGAGWFSWHEVEELLFDPSIVSMVEQMNSCDPSCYEDWLDDIVDYTKTRYGVNVYVGGAENLQVRWLPEGTKFYIDEYDGSESIMTLDDLEWRKA